MAVGSLLGKIDPEANFSLGCPECQIVRDFSPGVMLGNPGACVYETEHGFLWLDFDEIDLELVN